MRGPRGEGKTQERKCHTLGRSRRGFPKRNDLQGENQKEFPPPRLKNNKGPLAQRLNLQRGGLPSLIREKRDKESEISKKRSKINHGQKQGTLRVPTWDPVGEGNF